MAALTLLAQRGLLFLLLVEVGVLSLAWNFVAWLLHPIVPLRQGTAVGRAAIGRVYGTVWRTAEFFGMLQLDTGGLEKLAKVEGGLIIAANHPTMFDALILVSRLPRGVCIMKADLMRNVFVGPGARLARYICNDSPRGLVRCAVRCLQDGGQLVVFPEGTRTVRPPINEFRAGVSVIAKLAGVPIQTVIIETDTPYLRKGWPIWKPPAFPVRIRVRLGQRFAPEDDCDALLLKLERYFAGEIAT